MQHSSKWHRCSARPAAPPLPPLLLPPSLSCLPGTVYAYGGPQVLRLDARGRSRGFYVRRRDVLREHKLQPRDLRRIEPSVDFTKTSPSITIKENVLLLNLGGVRCGAAMAPRACTAPRSTHHLRMNLSWGTVRQSAATWHCGLDNSGHARARS